ncbi:hypothetical protein K432DRAFT_60095 [Lepidopterella palustris CBS 459.81]|uniref:YDG domain-containing protein n=1 Tax=Lepidopterella palustris CBS 459.81 TaxID=1314670 RepID=A0A8E2E952_9PEZI|nr:hypothetical protein K432DRAFT_60095 [Lepidopterella palustris CBS 459.81]
MPQPPGPDLSRPRLREIASWIRDTLDPLIAREGPDVMNIDDFLTLHEIFIALQYADISATALRATRIHRAVLEVASKATRWPGRLADECDRIIMIWRARFGPLEDLRPFLYGRGGRLEGIAGVTDITRTALLKRWRDTTPELVAPHRPRIHGSLGFQAGAWWLNSLFAFRDGIIDLETTDGGICFDSNGAYAVLLNDADEVEGVSPSSFTYRCHRNDAGRFRLTAADFKSRYPVRVLRSHSLNSLWAPRAGVRYDGLHRVAGWVIRAVLPSDTNHKMDELIFEIKFEREDTGQASMEEVMRHPLANEIDDYAEYKRLRRLQREAMRMKSVSAKPALELAKVVSELSTRSSSPKASAIGLTSTIGNTSKSIGKSSPDILVHSSRQLTRPHRPTIVNRYRPCKRIPRFQPSHRSQRSGSMDGLRFRCPTQRDRETANQFWRHGPSHNCDSKQH